MTVKFLDSELWQFFNVLVHISYAAGISAFMLFAHALNTGLRERAERKRAERYYGIHRKA